MCYSGIVLRSLRTVFLMHYLKVAIRLKQPEFIQPTAISIHHTTVLLKLAPLVGMMELLVSITLPLKAGTLLLRSMNQATVPEMKKSRGILKRLSQKLNSNSRLLVWLFLRCQPHFATYGMAEWKKRTPGIARIRSQSSQAWREFCVCIGWLFSKLTREGRRIKILLTTGRFEVVTGKCIVYDLFISASSDNFATLLKP